MDFKKTNELKEQTKVNNRRVSRMFSMMSIILLAVIQVFDHFWSLNKEYMWITSLAIVLIAFWVINYDYKNLDRFIDELQQKIEQKQRESN